MVVVIKDLSKNISKQGVGPRGHFTVKKTGGLDSLGSEILVGKDILGFLKILI